jgi:hypothetical protein
MSYRGSPNSFLQRRRRLSRQPITDIWDALEAKFGVSDAGGELYVMEQLYDYKMVEDCSIVE